MGKAFNTNIAHYNVVTLEYIASGVAPHGGTTRATYTVPSGYAARVLSVGIRVNRDSAASTAGWVHASVIFTPQGGTLRAFAGTAFNSNTVGYAQYYKDDIGLILKSGDAIGLYTSDGSTGGTVGYTMTLQIGLF